MKNLQKEIKSIVPTDELIALNKEYQRLCIVEEQYQQLIDNLFNLDLDADKQIKTLEKLQDSLIKEMVNVMKKTNDIVFLQKMFKGAMIIKAMKEVEKESIPF